LGCAFLIGCAGSPTQNRGEYDRVRGTYGLRPQDNASSNRDFKGYQAKGTISYYADKFEGRPTANGETYRGSGLTAAHRELPFGTRVKVTNLDNARDVYVRVNDRGPFAGNRIMDVSKAAAKALGMLGPGLAEARIEVVDP